MLVMLMFSGSAANIFISSVESTISVILLLFTYGASVIPLSYLYSLCFQSYSTAQISIMSIHFVTGFVTVIAYYVMTSIPETQELAASLVGLFRLFPPYNIGEGLINISVNNFLNSYRTYRKISYFRWTVTTRNIVFMAIESLVFFTILLIIESPIVWITLRDIIDRFKKIVLQNMFESTSYTNINTLNNTIDDDVYLEEETISNVTNKSEYSLLIKKLVKKYSDYTCGTNNIKYAVNKISFGCKQGER